MTSKKRWQEVYAGDNPLSLPQQIARELRSRVHRNGAGASHDELKYVWLYVSEDRGCGAAAEPQHVAEGRRLDIENWLNVIDESVMLGADGLIITVGEPIACHPEVWDIAEWAQLTHEMHVGIHVCDTQFGPTEVERLQRLDPTKICIFAERDGLDGLRALERYGVRVLKADGQEQAMVHPTCHLPETMACVGASGTLYTCGLVLGNDEYCMGHYNERALESVMKDPAVPHIVPEGLSKEKRGCNGCPPLMYRRLHGEEF